MSKNLVFALFVPAFILLYTAANTQNTTLGLVGIGLLGVNALAVLLKK
ncbi:MAG: hypothetical protein ACOX2K_02380 [Bacillota bacterium]|jgi:hypothetical protein